MTGACLVGKGSVSVNRNPLCCCYGGEIRLCRWRRRRLAYLGAVSSSEDWRSEVEGRNEEEAAWALSWSPWLSVEQNPSLIKGECRGDT